MFKPALAAVWIVTVVYGAAVRSGTIEEGLEERLDGVVRRYEDRGFSGAVLVAQEGTILLQRGYGFADRRAKRRNQPETLFEVASLTKPLTASAVFVLEQQGKLTLDDHLGQYIDAVPEAYREVTIFQLLSHTAGLPRGGPGRGVDFQRAAQAYLSLPPLFAPGTQQAYSNTGYALLAGIVEKASGKSFEQFCHEELFQTANMRSSGFCGEVFDDQRCARGYDSRGQERRADRDPYPPNSEFGFEYKGMGGLITNVLDLYQWHLAMEDGRFLSEKSRQRMETAVRGNYGCGWETFRFPNGMRCIGHGGTVRGYASKLWRFPDDDMVLIVLANSEPMPWNILKDLVETIVPGAYMTTESTAAR